LGGSKLKSNVTKSLNPMEGQDSDIEQLARVGNLTFLGRRRAQTNDFDRKLIAVEKSCEGRVSGGPGSQKLKKFKFFKTYQQILIGNLYKKWLKENQLTVNDLIRDPALMKAFDRIPVPWYLKRHFPQPKLQAVMKRIKHFLTSTLGKKRRVTERVFDETFEQPSPPTIPRFKTISNKKPRMSTNRDDSELSRTSEVRSPRRGLTDPFKKSLSEHRENQNGESKPPFVALKSTFGSLPKERPNNANFNFHSDIVKMECAHKYNRQDVEF
jgi:hypothetical protein